MNINSINGIVVGSLTAAMGVYPYIRRRNEVTKYFALANVALGIWNLDQLFIGGPQSHSIKLFLYRSLYIAGILLVPFFFKFMFAFMSIDVKNVKVLWRAIWAVSAILLAVVLTPLLVKDIRITPYLPIQEVHGPFYSIFVIFFLGVLGYALYRFFLAYRSSEGQRRIQFRYLFAALAVALMEGVLFFVSILFISVPSYYYYVQLLYVFLIAYTILAHRLMDITFIIRKTVIYSVVTGALTAVYLLVTTQLARVLEGVSGAPSMWSSAIAAGTIAVLFNPVLNRVRAFMDRRFFGEWLQDMSRGVVHEIKRPLANISLPAQLTLAELEDIEKGKRTFESFLPELKERLRTIVSNTMEAAESIEALYALTESNGHTPHMVRVEDVVHTSVAAAKKFLETPSVTLAVELAKNLPEVRGDSKQLEIVLVNLMKNAAEAMAAANDRRLQLKAWEEGKWVVFSVKDSGSGIRPEDRERLFDPNFTTKGSQGMGLGLYLSDKIIRRHGGTIDVTSEPGNGTAFIVRLPKSMEKNSVAA